MNIAIECLHASRSKTVFKMDDKASAIREIIKKMKKNLECAIWFVRVSQYLSWLCVVIALEAVG